MSKSIIETQYEKLIIQHISNINVCPEHRAVLFLDFFQNHEVYYESLCDLLYYLSSENLLVPIWMSQSGEIYSGTDRKSVSDIFLMDSLNLPEFDGDLINQFEAVFSRIYSITSNDRVSQLCMFTKTWL